MQLLGRQKGSGSASGSSSSKENLAVNPTAQEEVLEERLELLQSQLDLAQGQLVDQSNKSSEAHRLCNNADRRIKRAKSREEKLQKELKGFRVDLRVVEHEKDALAATVEEMKQEKEMSGEKMRQDREDEMGKMRWEKEVLRQEMKQNKDASVEEMKREKEATASLISVLEKSRHELQKSKRALQAKNTRATLSKAKVTNHAIDLEQKLDLAVQITSTRHLKDKGIVNDNARDMICDLVQCNIPVKYVAKAIGVVAEHFGIDVQDTISERTVSRAVLEGGIASTLQVVDEWNSSSSKPELLLSPQACSDHFYPHPRYHDKWRWYNSAKPKL